MMGRQKRFKESDTSNSSSRDSRQHLNSSRGLKTKAGSPKIDNKLALFVSFNVIVVVCSIIYLYFQKHPENIVTTSFNSLPVVSKSGLDSPEKFWGTYRSGLYFGLKTRSPHSLVTGLMWFPQKIVDNGLQIRHWCNQWDKIKKYGWLQHDGVNFGVQNIEEEDFILTTSFVKRAGGQNGGDWTAKITVKPKVPNVVPVPISILFYAATDEEGAIFPKVIDESHLSAIYGNTPTLGNFEMNFNSNPLEGAILKYNYLSTVAPKGFAQLKETVLRNMALFQSKRKGELQVLGLIGHSFKPEELHKQSQANFIVHQVTVLPPFEMEVIFESGSFYDRPETLSGQLYNTLLENYQKSFYKKFNELFRLKSKGYLQKDIRIAESVLSNMLGSIGYFYGSALVQSKYNKEPVRYWNAPLFTAVPSRSFFPRGFLWDEGFHNLLISQWDYNVTKDIIAHWFDLMNIEGWIPRELILGIEAQARVPEEFLVQRNTNANPPVFFLALESLLRRMQNGHIPEDKNFFSHIYPRLQAWFDWFNTTQVGKLPGSYCWRGRDAQTKRELNPKTLTSGLDDYPRASHPTDSERHIDLRCWMAFAARVMADISQIVNKPWEQYIATYRYLSDSLLMETLHWSPTSQSYSDFGLHTNAVKLIQPKPPSVPPGQPIPKMDKVRVVLEEPTLRYVDSFGYVSLFPFLLQILKPDNSKLGKLLLDLKDPQKLWTGYGLRSLSKQSPFYMKYNTEHDGPYWRGPIWININYLAVRALYYYSEIPGPYQEQAFNLYKELRQNIVSNILKEYNRTGYIWEQYSDKTGEGQGSHPFTGWSALVLLIMSEIY